MVNPISGPDRYGDAGPDLESVNGLIQARIDGVISRRELIVALRHWRSPRRSSA